MSDDRNVTNQIQLNEQALYNFVARNLSYFKRDTHGGEHYVYEDQYGQIMVWPEDRVLLVSVDDEALEFTIDKVSDLLWTSPMYNLVKKINRYGYTVEDSTWLHEATHRTE